MTSGPRIHRLWLESIRSIRSRLEIDLSAPLTVLLAPNGTGKTSICYGAEWLQTGQAGPEELKTADLGNLSDKGSPKVTAELIIGTKTWRVERASKLSCGEIGEKLKTVSQDALLDILAPSVNKAKEAAMRFRSSRFLYSNELAVLIDADEKSLDRRMNIFADLLGVGHLTKAEQNIASYLRATKEPHSRIVANLHDKRQEFAELSSIASVEEGVRNAERELLAGTSLLKMTPQEQKFSLDLRIASGIVELSKREQGHKARIDALSLVETTWTSWDGWEEENAKDAAALQSLNREMEAQGQEVAVQKTLRANRMAGFDRAHSERNTILDHHERLGSSWSRIKDIVSPTTSFTQLMKEWPEAVWDTEKLKRQLEKAQTFWPRLAVLERQHIELVGLKSRLAELPAIPDPADQDNLRTELMIADLDRTALELDLEKLSGPLDLLRRSGRHALEALANAHTCPLCSHDWQTVDALQRAVTATLEMTPAVVIELQSRVDEATREVASLRVAQDQWEEAKRISIKIADLERDILSVTNDIKNIININRSSDIRVSLNIYLDRIAKSQIIADFISYFKRSLSLCQAEDATRAVQF